MKPPTDGISRLLASIAGTYVHRCRATRPLVADRPAPPTFPWRQHTTIGTIDTGSHRCSVGDCETHVALARQCRLCSKRFAFCSKHDHDNGLRCLLALIQHASTVHTLEQWQSLSDEDS